MGGAEGAMGFFDIFRRPPPINDVATLGTFIDEQSAFVAQKGIYEYSRARAGHYAKVLFKEKDFLDAAEKARWTAYPLALAMVGEMVEGVLRRHAAAENQAAVRDALIRLTMDVFDNYPVPAAIGATAWRDARVELLRRLNGASLHPPKPVKDIPEPYARAYYDLMPIHQKLRASEFPTIRNYMRVTLINIHDQFVARADLPALADSLRRDPSP
jgi:hypothetical protein